MSASDDSKPWTVVVLKIAKREGRKILSAEQYEHMVEVEKRLVYWSRPEEIIDLDIEPIGDVYELKEKGGPLGKINLRVFFGVIQKASEIVVVKTYKKEREKHTPPHIILAVEDRFDDYKSGLYVHGNTTWRPDEEERGSNS